MSSGIFIRDVVHSARLYNSDIIELTLRERDAPLFVPSCCAARCIERYHEIEFNPTTIRWLSYGRGGRTRFDKPVEFSRLPVPD